MSHLSSQQIIDLLPPLACLNAWVRAPYEQRLGVDAVSAVYHMKNRMLTSAIQLGMATSRVVAVDRSCKTCRGTGEFKRWDQFGDDYWEGEDCRRCSASGKVVLKFLETTVEGRKFHTPSNKCSFWKDWDKAESTEWTPEQPGMFLDRASLIDLLNLAERIFTGGKLIRWDNGIWLNNPFRYHLHLGEFKLCFVCGEPTDRYGWEIYRPGLQWRQSACEACCWRLAPRWKDLPRQWPANLFREQPGRLEHDWPEWYSRVPLPGIGRSTAVEEWLARRGIVFGCIPPGDYCYVPEYDCWGEAVAAKDGVAYVLVTGGDHPLAVGYRNDVPLLKVSADALRGWKCKQLEAAR